MEADRIEIKTVLISVAVVVVIETIVGIAASTGAYSSILFLGTARFLEAVLIVLIVSTRESGLSPIGLAPSSIFSGLKRGLVWSTGFGIIVFLVAVVSFAGGINPIGLIHTSFPAGRSEITPFFLIGGMISPVAEEIFFRGIIYRFFRKWGVFTAVALSTLVFVLAHPAGSRFFLSQIVGGILFALAYEKEGNLTVPITIHILGNIAIFSLSLGY
ncbi:MAG: CPBP family intramembrane metalloprotease [Deltaproteobacteria bacterium]|nr:CPBP family intramembrane metalloprotease [Deltaproteobacteria bacterium]